MYDRRLISKYLKDMATDNRESELVQVLRSETLLGEIPLQLICEDLNVIAAFPPPRPYFVIASRYSYLHIIAAEYIQDLRSHYIVDTEVSEIVTDWPIL